MLDTRDSWGERLPRQLGLRSGIALVIMACVGGSIFRVPAMTSFQLGHLGPVLLVWLFGGVFALCGALSLAELAAALPRSGGLFTFILEAYGPLPAFVYGWAELAIVAPAGGATIALIFAEYLAFFFPLSDSHIRYVAAAALVFVGILNHLGVRLASLVTSVATVAVYGGLATFAFLAFHLGIRQHGSLRAGVGRRHSSFTARHRARGGDVHL
jgi:amino acid transporter